MLVQLAQKINYDYSCSGIRRRVKGYTQTEFSDVLVFIHTFMRIHIHTHTKLTGIAGVILMMQRAQS